MFKKAVLATIVWSLFATGEVYAEPSFTAPPGFLSHVLYTRDGNPISGVVAMQSFDFDSAGILYSFADERYIIRDPGGENEVLYDFVDDLGYTVYGTFLMIDNEIPPNVWFGESSYDNIYSVASNGGPGQTPISRGTLINNFDTAVNGQGQVFVSANTSGAQGNKIWYLTGAGWQEIACMGSSSGPIAFDGANNLYYGFASFFSSAEDVVYFTDAQVQAVIAGGAILSSSDATTYAEDMNLHYGLAIEASSGNIFASSCLGTMTRIEGLNQIEPFGNGDSPAVVRCYNGHVFILCTDESDYISTIFRLSKIPTPTPIPTPSVTPTPSVAPTPHIVIDQIYGAGLAEQPPDYVILWNPTTSDINLGDRGYMLSYGAASGIYESEHYIFNQNDIISATSYFMVANTNVISGVSADVVCNIDIIMNSNAGNSWVVFSNTDGIVDQVGWATDPEFFETAGIQNYLTNSTAFFRGTDVRHLDTDNNNADFFREDYIPTSSGNVEWFCHTLWPDGDQDTQEWILTDRPSPVCGGYYYRAVNEDFDLDGPPYIESSSKTASNSPPQAWFSLQDIPDGVMDSWGKVFVRVMAWGYQTGAVYTPVAIDSNNTIGWRNIQFSTNTSPPTPACCSGWNYDIDLGLGSYWSQSALDDLKIGIKNEAVSPGRLVVVPKICLQVFYTEQPTPTITPIPTITPTPSMIPTPSVAPTVIPTPSVMPTSSPTPSVTPTAAPVAPPWIYDYNGDGTSDIAIFRAEYGLWAIRGVTRVYFGGSSDDTAPGDYDGDGTTEIGIFRPASGLWALRGVSRVYFGSSSDLPVSGDYDGDGYADIVIFRPASGLWAIRGVTRTYFGGVVDEPVPGYYNGDGVKDIGIFRPTSGLWALRGISRMYFGGSTDETVPGDYDGDGTWEAGIFRPTSGLWAIRGVTRVYFGSSADYPVPAIYSGSGADSIGIFRPASGLWAIRGITRAYFGTLGDIPVTR